MEKQALRPVKHCGASTLQHLAFFLFAAGKTVGLGAHDEKQFKSVVDAAVIERLS